MKLRHLLSFALLLAGTLVFAKSPISAPAKTPMIVSTDWLEAHLTEPNLVILDIDSAPNAYQTGHIPGARFLNLREIVQPGPGGWSELPPPVTLKSVLERLGVGDRSRIVLYGGRSGVIAARAYFTFDFLGLGNRTSLLDGGLEKWRMEHRALAFDSLTPNPSSLTVHPHPELVADLTFVQRAVAARSLPLIDSRPPADYAGAAGSRSGHIPGAKNVFWGELLSSTEIPTLKPMPDIRSRYAAAGLKPGDKVIVYCHSGMQASYGYFTLKLAGFHPILYPGSFLQWASTPNSPIESVR